MPRAFHQEQPHMTFFLSEFDFGPRFLRRGNVLLIPRPLDERGRRAQIDGRPSQVKVAPTPRPSPPKTPYQPAIRLRTPNSRQNVVQKRAATSVPELAQIGEFANFRNPSFTTHRVLLAARRTSSISNCKVSLTTRHADRLPLLQH